MSDLLATRGKKKRKKERKSLRGEEATKPRARGIGWRSAEYHFFPLEKIFHFSAFRLSLLSPLPLLRGWDDVRGRREKKSFPLLSVSASTYGLRTLVEPDAPRRYSSCRLSNSTRDLA